MKARASVSAATLFCILPTVLSAAPFYAGLSAVAHRLEVSHTRFTPSSLRTELGYWLVTGIGLEARISQGVSDDEYHGLQLEIPQTFNLGLRFQSPASRGTRAYILLGGTALKLKGTSATQHYPGDETFTGGYAAIGLMQAFIPARLSVTLEYAQHFIDEDETIEPGDWSLGILYAF